MTTNTMTYLDGMLMTVLDECEAAGVDDSPEGEAAIVALQDAITRAVDADPVLKEAFHKPWLRYRRRRKASPAS